MSDELPLVKREETLPATQDNSPAAILRVAVETGLGAETIERLAALAWKQQDRDAAKEFVDAIAVFKQRCPPIIKTKIAREATSKGGRELYRFAPLDKIAAVVDPLLLDLGFSYSWDSETDEQGWMTTTCTLTHIGGHSAQSRFRCPAGEGTRIMSGPQKAAAAHSFARRQTLTAILGLTTTDDDTDGADLTTIDKDQVAQIEDMLTESGKSRERFFTAMGITDISEIYAGNFSKAVGMLRKGE